MEKSKLIKVALVLGGGLGTLIGGVLVNVASNQVLVYGKNKNWLLKEDK